MLRFRLPDGSKREIEVRHVLNGGYAGSNTEEVRHHIEELAELGIPGPTNTPTLYPLSATAASQTRSIQVQHGKTSGEAEWAMVVGEGAHDILLTAACDHTDRALEVHGVAWSKQVYPDVLGDLAWPLHEIKDRLAGFTLRGWVRHGGVETLIQDGVLGQLLPPSHWVKALSAVERLAPGTVVLSGTIPMIKGVDQFAEGWRVEIQDDRGRISRVEYGVEVLAKAWD